MKIENIKFELKEMYGKTLGSGYFKHTVQKPSPLEIDIIDVLDVLDPYEINNHDVDIYNEETEDHDWLIISMDEYYKMDQFDEEFEELNGTNSYNWGSPVSNHFNWRTFKNRYTDEILIQFAVHYGISDVRCGYTEDIWLQFNNEYEFLETIAETDKYYNVNVDGEEYEINIRVFADGIEILDSNGNELGWEEKEEIINKIDLNLLA